MTDEILSDGLIFGQVVLDTGEIVDCPYGTLLCYPVRDCRAWDVSPVPLPVLTTYDKL